LGDFFICSAFRDEAGDRVALPETAEVLPGLVKLTRVTLDGLLGDSHFPGDVILGEAGLDVGEDSVGRQLEMRGERTVVLAQQRTVRADFFLLEDLPHLLAYCAVGHAQVGSNLGAGVAFEQAL
jgi:hypothetical protein